LEVWDLIILRPILNFLVLLSNVMFDNFGLAIIVLTILVRAAMAPLTLRQLHASKKMQEGMNAIRPKVEQLKKKHAKNPQKLREEQMKLYKEAGVSPMGCLSSPMIVTMIIQIPIFIALYRSIIQALAVTPQDFLGLSQSLYSWSIVTEALPVSGHFLWLDLARPDPFFILPLLVMASMWVSQKMMARPTSGDPQQQSMQNMMQLMMPLMFGFITFTLPGGLGLYFVVVTAVGIVVQSFVYGWRNPFVRLPAQQTVVKKPRSLRDIRKTLSPFEQSSDPQEGASHGKSGSKRKDGGGSH
jgi:YidC/Oxa1 family membrane protein insertase